ncbi:MAG: stage II sporulation protein M [Thermodesulfobacteriota bacterium]
MTFTDIKESYRRAFSLAGDYKNLLTFLALTNIVFFFFGQWMIAQEIPGVVEFRKEVMKNIPDLLYLKPLAGPLAPSLILKIIYTFIFNLSVGAFLTTTAPGVVFFLPYLVSVMRAWSIGVIFYGLIPHPLLAIAFYGTFILEFGAYVISAAAGIDIGLSLLLPSRKGKSTRSDAFRTAFKNTYALYLIVATLLLLGAVWEMAWLHIASIYLPHDLSLPGNKDML